MKKKNKKRAKKAKTKHDNGAQQQTTKRNKPKAEDRNSDCKGTLKVTLILLTEITITNWQAIVDASQMQYHYAQV